MKRTLPALAVSANLSGRAAPAFPLRKTLLALTIGAITQSAVAADNTADSNKNEEVMLVQATEGSDFKAGL